jgi:hypothetical protein
MKTIMVAGSARSLSEEARQASRVIGRALAEAGFGLVTGSWSGVDHQTADAYLSALSRLSVDPVGRYTQIHYPRLRLFSAVPPGAARLRTVLPSGRDAHREAVRLADGGILIGGLGGAKDVAFELIGSGRPVFPLPLTGGDALDAYAEILERWADQSVPGLTRSQFMSLSLPIGNRGDALIRLLRAALEERVEIFISYRRSDVPAAAGRLAERLSEHIGLRRVFLDTHSIAPGTTFDNRIDEALAQCRLVICLIGPRWEISRLGNNADYVRREIEAALVRSIPVIPVLAYGGVLPSETDLPVSLHKLLDWQAVAIADNAAWERGLLGILGEIDRISGRPMTLTPTTRDESGATSGPPGTG